MKKEIIQSLSLNFDWRAAGDIGAVICLANGGYFGFKRKELTLFYSLETKKICQVQEIKGTTISLGFFKSKEITKKELAQVMEQKIIFSKRSK
jgi:hypothetical protein